MTDDDPQLGEPEELFAPPGARRSTYTPPVNSETTLRNAAKVFSDEEIAAALAESMPTLPNRPAAASPVAGPIAEPVSEPVSEPAAEPVAEPVPELVAAAEPVYIAVPESVEVPEPVVVPLPDPVAATEPPVVSLPEPVAVAEPQAVVVPVPVEATEPEPVFVSLPEPVAVAEPEQETVSVPEPVVAAEPAPTAAAVEPTPSQPAQRSFGEDVPPPADAFEFDSISVVAPEPVAVAPSSAPADTVPAAVNDGDDHAEEAAVPFSVVDELPAYESASVDGEESADNADTDTVAAPDEAPADTFAPFEAEPAADVVSEPVAVSEPTSSSEPTTSSELTSSSEPSGYVEATHEASPSPTVPPLAEDLLVEELENEAGNSADTLGLIERLETRAARRARENAEAAALEAEQSSPQVSGEAEFEETNEPARGDNEPEPAAERVIAADSDAQGDTASSAPGVVAPQSWSLESTDNTSDTDDTDGTDDTDDAAVLGELYDDPALAAEVEPETIADADADVIDSSDTDGDTDSDTDGDTGSDADDEPDGMSGLFAALAEQHEAEELELEAELNNEESLPGPDGAEASESAPRDGVLPPAFDDLLFAPVPEADPQTLVIPGLLPEPGLEPEPTPATKPLEVQPADSVADPFAVPAAEFPDMESDSTEDAELDSTGDSSVAELVPAHSLVDVPGVDETNDGQGSEPGPHEVQLAESEQAEFVPWQLPEDTTAATDTDATVEPDEPSPPGSEASGEPFPLSPDSASVVGAGTAPLLEVSAPNSSDDEPPAFTALLDGSAILPPHEETRAPDWLIDPDTDAPSEARSGSSPELSAEVSTEVSAPGAVEPEDGPEQQPEPVVAEPPVLTAPVAEESEAVAAVYGGLSPAASAAPPVVKPPSVFLPEEAGVEPTARDLRVGKAARLFWLWFAANASLVSVAFGAVLFSLGMSLRQSIVAILAGVALSFLPLGLGTLAGKRSGAPTMVVSRAAFGVVGNVLPTVVALVSRLFWGAALLWVVGAGTASILVRADLAGSFGESQVTLLVMGIGFLLALLIAYCGYALFARIQLVLSILSGALVLGFIAFTAGDLNITVALTVPDGNWTLVLTGAVLVFSFVGLVWANSTSDLARYQRSSTSSGGSMIWATLGTVLPSFVLIGYGALLAASNTELAADLVAQPLDALGSLLPGWYPIPLVVATAVSLLSGVVITIYSAAFALQALGARVSRPMSVVLVGVGLAVIAGVLTYTVVDFTGLFRDFATTMAVPVAAWAGIFAADTMIRNRRYDNRSLLNRGGIYSDVRWVNLSAFVVISAIGFGLTSATIGWLSWQGYLFTAFGLPLDGTVAGTDVGVVIALLLGLLTPIVSGIPAVRRQESLVGRPE